MSQRITHIISALLLLLLNLDSIQGATIGSQYNGYWYTVNAWAGASNPFLLTAAYSNGATLTPDITPLAALCQSITSGSENDGQLGITSSIVDIWSNRACIFNALYPDQYDFDCIDALNSANVTLADVFLIGNNRTCVAQESVLSTEASFYCQTKFDIEPNVRFTAPVPCKIGMLPNNTAYFHYNPKWQGLLYAKGSAAVIKNAHFNGMSRDLSMEVDSLMQIAGLYARSYFIESNGFKDQQTFNSRISDLALIIDTFLQTDTVQDTEDPVAICQTTTLIIEGGPVTLNPTAINNGSTDNEGISSMTVNPSYFNAPGTYAVTLTVYDAAGNSAQCTDSVNVIDTEPPVCQTQDITVNLNSSGAVSITPASIDNGSTDNGTIVSYSIDISDFNCSNIGPNTVTLTLTDEDGNQSSCSAIVTVEDTIAPIISSCPTDTLISSTIGECGIDGALVTLDSPIAYDGCGSVTITYDAPAYYPEGITSVTWNIADQYGNESFCYQNVQVIDDSGPIIDSCPSDIAVDNDPGICGAVVSYTLPSSAETCDSVTVVLIEGIASGEEFPLGDTYVRYHLIDEGGNISTCAFNVAVTDTESPVIAEPKQIIIMGISDECGSTVSYADPQATDNCPGLTTVQTDNTGLSSGDIFPTGTTTLCYLSTDASGNSTELCFDVLITDNESPIVTACPDDITIPAQTGNCSTVYSIPSPITEDNCGTTIMSNDAPSAFPVGQTIITWTITDGSGNTSLCSYAVYVFDEELPLIDCPDDVIYIAAFNECEVFLTVPLPVVSDNCGVYTVWNDFNNGPDASGIFPLGTTIITWHVLDIHGNENACIMSVTIETPGEPQITCPSDINMNNELGLCGAEVNVSAVFLKNPCSMVSVINDFNGTDDASGFYQVGQTNVIWTVTDITGHTATCTMLVTLTDSEAPAITCPDDITLPNDPWECGALVDYQLPSVFDNCGIDQLILQEGPFEGTMFNVGGTLVIYQVNDLNGNSNRCSFEVTVFDNESPSIYCPENIVQADSMVYYSYPGFVDNCYIELMLLSGPDTGADFDHGNTLVTFAAVDLYGNIDTCSFNVLVNTPPLAQNDTLVIFESGDIVTIEILNNDYDLDGDSIFIASIIYGPEWATIENSLLYYDLPDNDCGLDSVVYVLMDEYGATDTATVYVELTCHPAVFVPEGFSPNGDGVNDVLRILGLHEYPNNTLTVYNRWGHEVYSAKSYKNDWDGRSEAPMTLGKTLLPRGTYFYLLELEDPSQKSMKGFIYMNPK